MDFSHKYIEKKWQKYWDINNIFKTTNKNDKKSYVLDMFPYPSGAGLHVGHPKSYTATDVYARFKRMQGYDVLHPIGWDAFGLPAEQYALKTGNHPEGFTDKNINNFRKQLKSLGFSYDYDKEINTSKKYYYKTTQFIFKKMYQNGLANLKEIDVNWCEELKTVLANEEIILQNGLMVSKRGNFPVVKKVMKQWTLKITKYAKKLLDGLDSLDWPESVKRLQKYWIGYSKGFEIQFKIVNLEQLLSVYTTRIDTIFGISYIAIAAEHPLVLKLANKNKNNKILKFIKEIRTKTELYRIDESKEKFGIPLGYNAIHPITGKKIPIWVTDYVMLHYGTGSLIGVPAHDKRDFAFAKKYNLPIKFIIDTKNKNQAFTCDGIHINSSFLNGLNILQSKEKFIQLAKTEKYLKIKENFKLKDWLFSRQRYWGEPFPIIHWQDGSITLLSDDELPLELPNINKKMLTKSALKPLDNATDWLNVKSKTGLKGKRETNTMPQWAGSCWYYLAYILKSKDKLIDLNSKEAIPLLKKWLPVDLYIGGQEHAVLHLLYARFWHRFLYDIGLVPTKEPFKRLINQGMILGPNNQKMSKSKGNVINPDQIILTHGADALRLYEMFMGPITATLPWNINGVDITRKWLDRVYRFYNVVKADLKNNHNLDYIYNLTLKEVSLKVEKVELNIVISKLMTLLNAFYKEKNIYINYLKGFIQMLSIFAPHLAEEIWFNKLNQSKSVAISIWPSFNEKLINKKDIIIIVQINGKIKATIINNKLEKEKLIKQAKLLPKIKELIKDKKIKKIIFIHNKIINFVV